MAKAPAFQFYAKDWLDMRVMRMSFEAQGVYIRLLAHIWADTDTQFSIENNSKMLSRMIGISEKKFKKIFAEIQWPNDPIFILEGGLLVSKRLRKEKEKQVKISIKRSAAAQTRWEPDDANAYANAKQMECKRHALQSSSSFSEKEKNKETPPPPPSRGVTRPPAADREFDEFWQAYPKRKSRGQAKKTWDKLRREKRLPPLSTILHAIAAAKAGHDWQKDGGQYIPHPSTWLNDEGWEDEHTSALVAQVARQGSFPLTPRQQQTERLRGMAIALKNREANGNGANHAGGCGGDADALLGVLPGPGCERGNPGDPR